MNPAISSTEKRAALLRQFFPAGVPELWCPPLTHYTKEGAIDRGRIAAHLRHLAPCVKGFLIPGSTSDGWELTEAETRQWLELAMDLTRELKLHLLIAVLKPEAGTALPTIGKLMEWIKSRTGQASNERALLAAGVCGFTVCAPRGKNVSQGDMERELVPILELGLPIALYQLPQITQNEIGPELVNELARRFSNFILFKDSSGNDRVVLSGKDLGGVFTMRGAEGDYAGWFGAESASYGGFLLSTANCFAPQLSQMLEQIKAGELRSARVLSEQVTNVINEVFKLVRTWPDGNIYANANKAIDHYFAFGPKAADVPPPRLHAGSFLPEEFIRSTGEVLLRHELMPNHGYAEKR